MTPPDQKTALSTREGAALLRIGFGNVVQAPDAETAFQELQSLSGQALDPAAFHAAVAEALARGLIREPVRLPEGSLQCHWRLELTPEGVAAARAALAGH
jgi:hypothetical protein